MSRTFKRQPKREKQKQIKQHVGNKTGSKRTLNLQYFDDEPDE